MDKDLLDILACPACQGGVAQENGQIVCLICRRQYALRDGVAVMMVND